MYFQTQFSVNIRTLNQFSNSTFRETSVSVKYSWVYTNTTPSVNTLKNARNTGVVDIVFIFERNYAACCKCIHIGHSRPVQSCSTLRAI